MSEPRAIVFDLDDTLYPLRSFVSSGFAAAADALAPELGVSPEDVLAVLREAREFTPGLEAQCLADRYGLESEAFVDRFVGIVRGHWPDIRLPFESHRALLELRPDWRIGILTNGLPEVQRRKVAALGLRDLVDAVVFAAECGDGTGKPEREPFFAVLDELRVSASRTVFVGDDLGLDIFGAARVGMRTIHLTHGLPPVTGHVPTQPDARVPRIGSVPRVAERLIEGKACVYAA